MLDSMRSCCASVLSAGEAKEAARETAVGAVKRRGVAANCKAVHALDEEPRCSSEARCSVSSEARYSAPRDTRRDTVHALDEAPRGAARYSLRAYTALVHALNEAPRDTLCLLV